MTKSIIWNILFTTCSDFKGLQINTLLSKFTLIVVKLFTLTNTNDKTRSIGSTFIWQLKYCFQWQAYFPPNFAQSGIH
jgi:hypothetical protein